MKKLAICIFCFALFLLTAIPANAFGGFVVKEGSNIYHDIYCDLIAGSQLSELIWFDTAAQASAAGFVSCSVCDSANGFDFEYDLDTNWKTDDHLLQSAMEIESEIAYYKGYKDGEEEFSKEGFDSGYKTGWEEGQNAGYDIGHNNGYDAGFDCGYDAGYEKARSEFESDSAEESSEISGVLFVACICVAIILFAHLLDKKKAKF